VKSVFILFLCAGEIGTLLLAIFLGADAASEAMLQLLFFIVKESRDRQCRVFIQADNRVLRDSLLLLGGFSALLSLLLCVQTLVMTLDILYL
jgi:hypothetical protein